MPGNVIDPRRKKQPTIDELLTAVAKVLGKEGESVGDTLFRAWIEESMDLNEMADAVGTTLARLRALMRFHDIHDPTNLTAAQVEAHAVRMIVDEGWSSTDVAFQLGVPRDRIREIVEKHKLEEYDLAVPDSGEQACRAESSSSGPPGSPRPVDGGASGATS